MKRICLFLLLLSPTFAKADDFADMWKKISSYRITSGVKATGTGIAGFTALVAGWYATREVGRHVKDFNHHNSLLPQFNNLGWHGVVAGGMYYTSYQLLWNYCRVYAMHALAIK